MQAQKICIGNYLIPGDLLHLVHSGKVLVREWIISQHLAIKPLKPQSKLFANRSQSQNPDRLPLQRELQRGRGNCPEREAWMAAGIWRARVSIKPKANSATETEFAPGVFVTTIPRSPAACKSTPSTPTPYRAITFNRSACSKPRGRSHLSQQCSHPPQEQPGYFGRCQAVCRLGYEEEPLQPGKLQIRSSGSGNFPV